MAPKCPSSTPDIFLIQMYFSNTMKIPDFVFFPWYLFLIAIKRNSTILSDKKEKKGKNSTTPLTSSFPSSLSQWKHILLMERPLLTSPDTCSHLGEAT